VALSDSAGDTVEKYSYDVYGAFVMLDADGNIKAVSLVGNPYFFTGRRYQAELAQLMHDRQALFKNLVILAKAAGILDIPVLWCQQWPDSTALPSRPRRKQMDKNRLHGDIDKTPKNLTI